MASTIRAANMTARAIWWIGGPKRRRQAQFQRSTRNASSINISGYVAVDDVHVNGKLTLGENVADLGGVRLGYLALMKMLAEEACAEPIGGFTPAQRYFIAYAQSWCRRHTARASVKLQNAATDPHSRRPKFRVNGVVSDMPEFRRRLLVQAGPRRWSECQGLPRVVDEPDIPDDLELDEGLLVEPELKSAHRDRAGRAGVAGQRLDRALAALPCPTCRVMRSPGPAGRG